MYKRKEKKDNKTVEIKYKQLGGDKVKLYLFPPKREKTISKHHRNVYASF